MPIDTPDVAVRRERRLGEILLARGGIDEDQLRGLVEEQERTGRLLGELAVTMGLAHSGDVSSALGEQMDWSPVAELSPEAPSTEMQPERDLHLVLVQNHSSDHLIEGEGTTPAAGEAGEEMSWSPVVEPTIQEPLPDARPELDRHLVLVPTHSGYHLVEREGSAPAVGETVEVPIHDRVARYVVVRTTRAPLPASSLRCARLEAV